MSGGARQAATHAKPITAAKGISLPERLLPLIRRRFAPGGVLAFSNTPAVPGSYGVQGMYGAGFNGRRLWIYRWDHTPEGWAVIIEQPGFVAVDARR